MAFDVEQFFESIDIILTQRLSDLSFDSTVIATIVDDSDKARGHYVVSDGTIKFDAYTNDTSYQNDDQVRITILNGDWSQKKFIEGKYTDGDGTSAIPYIPPLGTTMQDNQSTLTTIDDFVLYANYSNPQQIWSQKITPDSDYYTLQTNGIYNVITLQGDFATDLDAASIISGNYGLLLELFIQPEVDSNDRIRKYITFDSSEMIGNPYSFVIDSHQAKQIAIASEGIVTEIILSIYQARDFTVSEDGKNLVTTNTPFMLRDGTALPGESGQNPIWFNNITIGFGSDLTQVEDNSLKLYTTSSATYHYNEGLGDETNDKKLGFIWYNKSDSNGYVGFSDGIYDLGYSEIKYNEESWADSRLLEQKGRTNIANDETSLTLAANFAESEQYMIKAYEALTTDLSGVLQSLGRQISNTSLADELNKLITAVNGSAAILVQKRDAAEQATQDLAAMYSGVLQYAYNVQNGTGEAEWNNEWDNANYFQDFLDAFEIEAEEDIEDPPKGAFNAVEDFLDLMQEETAAGKSLSGYRGIYNAYAPKVRKAIAAIRVPLGQIVHTTNGQEDVTVLKSYKDRTDYSEYGAKDLSEYDNKYAIYWYRYNEGYSLQHITPVASDEWTDENKTYDEYVAECEANNYEYKYANFLGDNWERVTVTSNLDEDGVPIPLLDNFGVPRTEGATVETKDEDGSVTGTVTYYPASPEEAQILYRRMVPTTEEERYQVVLFYNHEMVKSNVVTFTNTQADQIPMEFKVDANDALKIEHGTYSQDHYQSYSSAYDLVNIADESRSRQLRVSYDGVLVGDEALAGAGIYWYIPNNSTMLTYDVNYLVNSLGFNSDGISSTTLTLTGAAAATEYTYIEDLPDTIILVDGKIGAKTIMSHDRENKKITLSKTLDSENEITNVEYTAEEITNQTPYSRNGYTYFYKEIRYETKEVEAKDADGQIIYNADGTAATDSVITIEEADRIFAYKIKPYYEASAQNNTILVEAHVTGHGGEEKVTVGEISFTFSTFGTNGTKYTFVMTPATNQIAVLPDSDENDEVIDGSLNLLLSLRNADNELILMTDEPLANTNADGEVESYDIDAYSLTVGWHGKPPSEGENVQIGGIAPTTISDSEQWNVEVSLSNNAYKYQGIVKAQVQYNAEGKTDADTRIIQLSNLYPVPFAASENYYISGPTTIVYDNQGVISRYNEEPFKLYSRYVDSGEKDSDGNIIFKENVEVDDQRWFLVYYRNGGTRLSEANMGKDAYKAILAYMPTLNKDNTIMPAPMYYKYDDGEAFYVPVAVCVNTNNDILWSQPIVITQNQYASSTLNDWNGQFEINEANGTIMSTMLGAGIKTENNTFEGVLIGDIEAGANFDSDNADGIGIYGFNDGAQSFYFGVNGKAFLGKAGRGRIYFDGNSGTISSASYQQNRTPQYDEDGNIVGYDTYDGAGGMMIDLDDGFIDMKGVSKEEYLPTSANDVMTEEEWESLKETSPNDQFIGYTDEDDVWHDYTYDEYCEKFGTELVKHYKQSGIRIDVCNPYFKIHSANQVDPNIYLMYIGDSEYYLRSDDYVPCTFDLSESNTVDFTGAGMFINLVNGEINSYNFKLMSKNVLIDSTDTAKTFFAVKDNYNQILMLVGQNKDAADEYYLKSSHFNDDLHRGTKIDLADGSITSYNFTLIAGVVGDDADESLKGLPTIEMRSTGEPYLRIRDEDNGATLLHISEPITTGGSAFYYLQSPDFSDANGTGLKLDFINHTLSAYEGFKLKAYQSGSNSNYISINAGASDYPFIIHGETEENDTTVTREFKVNWNGGMEATGGYFKGEINATSGSLGSLTVTGTLDGGTITGAEITAKVLKAGAVGGDDGKTYQLVANSSGVTIRGADIYGKTTDGQPSYQLGTGGLMEAAYAKFTDITVIDSLTVQGKVTDSSSGNSVAGTVMYVDSSGNISLTGTVTFSSTQQIFFSDLKTDGTCINALGGKQLVLTSTTGTWIKSKGEDYSDSSITGKFGIFLQATGAINLTSSTVAIGQAAGSDNKYGSTTTIYGNLIIKADTSFKGNVALEGAQSIQLPKGSSISVYKEDGVNTQSLLDYIEDNSSAFIKIGSMSVPDSILDLTDDTTTSKRIGYCKNATNASYVYATAEMTNGSAVYCTRYYNDGTITLGPSGSSMRFKNSIITDFDSSVLYQLQPTKFKYNLDRGMPDNYYYGFIAEEVAKYFNDAVLYDNNGKAADLIYNSIFTLAVAEIQKLRKELDELKSSL